MATFFFILASKAPSASTSKEVLSSECEGAVVATDDGFAHCTTLPSCDRWEYLPASEVVKPMWKVSTPKEVKGNPTDWSWPVLQTDQGVLERKPMTSNYSGFAKLEGDQKEPLHSPQSHEIHNAADSHAKCTGELEIEKSHNQTPLKFGKP